MEDKGQVVFVGLDVSKDTLSVSVADEGRDDEIRDWGTVSTAPTAVERLLKKLATRFHRVDVCYEVGPTGYGLYRQITAFGFDCCVVAPSLIPMRAGGVLALNHAQFGALFAGLDWRKAKALETRPSAAAE